MRNWNNSAVSKMLQVELFPAYLWGIETESKLDTGQWCGQFPAYLWGIDTPLRSPIAPASRHFQPTYEELKHFFIHLCGNGKQNFQPTYEELKHCNLPRIFFHKPISSLPMRNWNFLSRARAEVPQPISSLPMRNWNRYGLAALISRAEHFQPTYEELKPEILLDGFVVLINFQPTYEELKL